MPKRVINQRPGPVLSRALALLPFALALLAYVTASTMAGESRVLPSLATMANDIAKLATEPSQRTGALVFWSDTAASLTRLGMGVVISAITGLVVGTLTGLIPYVNRTFSPFLAAVSLVPPLAVLPILFIAFGVGELAKVVLIVFGIAPFIARDVQQHVEQLPREQLVKAQSLGGSSWQILLRVVLPQTVPRLLDVTRLAMGAAWLFLIASEAIAATEGLGYRIFLVRRYLDMATILPYVAWITLLAFLFDLALRWINRIVFPWYGPEDNA